MVRSVVAALAVVAALLPASAAAEDPAYSSGYRECVDKAAGMILLTVQCIDAETKAQDARLGATYKSLQDKLSPKRRRTLTAAQRAWTSFRGLNCKHYLNPDAGTWARVDGALCIMVMAAQRNAELARLLEGEVAR
jgi:uncharacterized protein YecT (DUF1311 family)